MLKFTPLGKKFPFHVVGQAVGMGRAFCAGPGQSVPGKLLPPLSLCCQAGHTSTHAQQPGLSCECACQAHTAPLFLTFSPVAPSPVAWPTRSLAQMLQQEHTLCCLPESLLGPADSCLECQAETGTWLALPTASAPAQPEGGQVFLPFI